MFAPREPAPAPQQWNVLDWSEFWLRVWYEEWATAEERAAYHEALPKVKAERGVEGKCLSCANEARRIAMRGRWKVAA
jgi:hypothetical protein